MIFHVESAGKENTRRRMESIWTSKVTFSLEEDTHLMRMMRQLRRLKLTLKRRTEVL